jgi:oligoendopeptidase F
VTPPTPRELDALREDADRFDAELMEEYYLQSAGHKEALELEPIYERHADLTKLETAQRVGAAVDGDRRTRELWKFVSEGYLSSLTTGHAERVAQLEAELEAKVDGETIPFRMLRVVAANEPDRDRRQRIEEERYRLQDEHLNPIYLEATRIEHRAVTEDLGAPNYAELYRRFGFRLDDLADQCRELLDSTERMYEESIDRLLRARLGVGLEDAQPWDTMRLFRAPEWDPQFPADRMLPALEATLGDLGIDLRSQRNIHLDLESRPNKSPRAFCAPIEVPDRVMLVIQPIGGLDDWRALFHEAGHAEHFGNTSRDLHFEEKRLGDLAITEGWAMLLQHLIDDPEWLNRRLDFPKPREFAAEGATSLLYFVRRYSAKLLYELEFHGGRDPETMRDRYVELLSDAQKIPAAGANYLLDIDSGFYVTSYLRSWAFEAQLRDFLREEYGSAWFTRREAGSLLRELWALGQQPTADELLKDVTGAELQMAAVGDRIREALR